MPGITEIISRIDIVSVVFIGKSSLKMKNGGSLCRRLFINPEAGPPDSLCGSNGEPEAHRTSYGRAVEVSFPSPLFLRSGKYIAKFSFDKLKFVGLFF